VIVTIRRLALPTTTSEIAHLLEQHRSIKIRTISLNLLYLVFQSKLDAAPAVKKKCSCNRPQQPECHNLTLTPFGSCHFQNVLFMTGPKLTGCGTHGGNA
jgi:hypothetical protein